MDQANLSPEDISSLQKQQCIFCHIVSERVASKKVYEDEKFVAILDINPANPGHMLVISKEHYMIMPQMPEDDIGYLGMLAKALSRAALRALNCHGTNVFIANGVVAGQRAQHFMLHVIPRMEGDNIGLDIPEKSIKIPRELMKRLANSINKSFGLADNVEFENTELEKAEVNKVKGEKKSDKKRLNLDEITDFLDKNGKL